MKSTFSTFAQDVNNKFCQMSQGQLFVLDIDKDELWQTYLNSFPKNSDPIFRTRSYHDCSCCRNFIKNIGSVVSLSNGKVESVWDVITPGFYQGVADRLSEFLSASKIKNIFLTSEHKYGTKTNSAIIDEKTYTFNHFWCDVPSRFVNKDPGPKLSHAESSFLVFSRGLQELTPESLDTVLELIDANSLYRGTEFRDQVIQFRDMQRKYLQLQTRRDIFTWSNISSQSSRIRNSAIGTLLQDLSEGIKDLDQCLKTYENVMAPANYKRPTAVVTKSMIDQAVKTIEELGIEDSLYRRHATLEDISASDVLFVDRAASKKLQGVAAILKSDAKVKPKNLSETQEIGIEDFISNVLPNTQSLEVLVENKHTSNFCNILAPVNYSKPIFKWDSNFSWSYNGNITDSMKENVKKFGGKVEGVLRFSIQWNDKNDNRNDLDAHCVQPFGYEISFRMKTGHASGGNLDVDIITPNGLAVENIIFPDINKMKNGTYQFYVHNFSGTSGENFSAEIEFDNTIYSYRYEGRTKGTMYVADVTLKNGQFSIVHKMPHGEQSKDVYGLKTQAFHKVNLVTTSPNYWRGKGVGNKHYMFIIDQCKNPEPTRGFYNEFLDNSLMQHRKVFEVLSGKMQCPYSDNQLAGLGFSSTQRAELVVKANGAISRTFKVKF